MYTAFPLYTEVMGKGKAKGDGSQPEVPQKQFTHWQEDMNLSRNEEVLTVPEQNLTPKKHY